MYTVLMGYTIRPINPKSTEEIRLVAQRMGETLIEVLGDEQGSKMYSPQWLKERVLYHLDALQVTAAVYIAITIDGKIVGHTIVRVDKDINGSSIGLFATTFVAKEARSQGIATALVLRGEEWVIHQKVQRAVTYTDQANTKLIRLFQKQGYQLTHYYPEKKMISLEKNLQRHIHST